MGSHSFSKVVCLILKTLNSLCTHVLPGEATGRLCSQLPLRNSELATGSGGELGSERRHQVSEELIIGPLQRETGTPGAEAGEQLQTRLCSQPHQWHNHAQLLFSQKAGLNPVHAMLCSISCSRLILMKGCTSPFTSPLPT